MSLNKSGELTPEGVLNDALEDDFDEVLIIGIKNRNLRYYLTAGNHNEVIGVLERIKANLINNMDN